MPEKTENFSTYELYHDKESARELIRILKRNQIAYEFEDDSPAFDPSFANLDINRNFRVKIHPNDFEQADELMLKIAESQFDQVTPNYFLFSFTDKELLDVISKRDEWGHFNYAFAQKLLRDRGIPVSKEHLTTLYAQRIEKLSIPEAQSSTWIFAGYVLAFLGGLLGLFIGWHLSTHKKTLPNGNQVYAYTSKDRMHGKYIFIISACVLVLLVLKRILTGEAARF